jgi:hypothetical protein
MLKAYMNRRHDSRFLCEGISLFNEKEVLVPNKKVCVEWADLPEYKFFGESDKEGYVQFTYYWHRQHGWYEMPSYVSVWQPCLEENVPGWCDYCEKVEGDYYTIEN